MNFKLIPLFVFFCCSQFSYAQFVNPSNLPNAAANAVTAAVYTFKKDNIPKDSISGSCTYNEGSCNGAEVSLFKDNVKVY